MMSNDKTFGSIGEKMVYAIENGQIMKDYLPNHGDTFHGGYEELYLHKFKTYLGSVSRAIINRNLAKERGNGI
jgi:hypothetical protein